MSGLTGRERLQPSLLDRLTDNAPTQKRESFEQQTLTMPQLRNAVLRDMANLLNTTNLSTLKDLANFPLAAKSTINFGIPGFAGMIESLGRNMSLERELVEAIQTFEPRIRSETVRVHAQSVPADGNGTAVVFHIEGELWAKPVPQHLTLETAIEVETRVAVVNEIKGAR